jgi:acetyltransferase-like isoleucine patch superfamily enzyme
MSEKPIVLGKLKAATIIIEEGCFIGEDVEIISDYIHIKKYTKLSGLKAHCPDKFIIGECGYIGSNCKIKCRSFDAGQYLWMTGDVEVGRGGCDGPNSHVKIGNYCMVIDGAVINPSEAVTIGDEVAIGSGANIWTHGSFLDILDGFPANFAPVSIGNHVWIPSKCTILPGVNVGDNVVISLGSVVNKNLPSGCLAAGVPAKIIKTDVYPKKLTKEQRSKTAIEVITYWYTHLVPYKGIKTITSLGYDNDKEIVLLNQNEGSITEYNLDNRTILGYNNDVSEDLRDFMRRRGIKIFTGKPFKSIVPPIFK